MTEVEAADAPSLAQNAIKFAIDFAEDAIASKNDAEKVAAYKLLEPVINSAAALISLDAATCDKVERLVQTVHISALAAEDGEEAKEASRLEMRQLRATILRMKASTQSTAAAPAAVAPRTEPAVAPPAVVAPPPSEVPAAAPASLTTEAAPLPEAMSEEAQKLHEELVLLRAENAGLKTRPTDVQSAPDVAPPGTKKRPRADTAESPSDLRKGKWTSDEVAYAEKIIDQFETGRLSASFEGQTLRLILAELLKCDPMRVTKKFAASGKLKGGKSRSTVYAVKAKTSELEAAATELATLRDAYIASLPAPKPPKAPKEPKHEAELRAITTHFASGDAALVAAVAAAEPIARGNDANAQADAFNPFSSAVLAADPAQVRLDAAASRLLLSVAEVLYEKARKAANSKPGDSLSKNMVNLRKKIAQLGPQAPAVAAAATQALVAALDKAKLALDAADDATKAKAYDALRRALTQAEYKASLDVPTHDDLLRVGMTLHAAKNYQPNSFRPTKSKLESDIKALCPALANAGPAPRRQRDAASALTVPKEAFSADGFDQRFLDMIDGEPAAKRRKPGTAVQDENEAQRREEEREAARWRAAAAQPGFSPKDVPQRDAMSNDIIQKVDQVCASLPGHTKMIYVGAALLERILTGDGSIGPEAIAFLGRDESVLRCKKTGKRLSMPQIRALRRAGALVVVHSRSHTNGAIVDAGERSSQVGVRERMVAPPDGPRAAAYGLTTPGTVAKQPGEKLLYGTIISLEKAANASVIRAEIKLPGAFVSIYSRRPPRRRRDVSSTAWRCRRLAAHSTHWSICTQTWSSSSPTCRR